MNVSDVMTPLPLTVTADVQLRAALERMHSHDVRHLVVVDDGALVGLLSDRNIKRHMSAAYDTALEEPRDRILMRGPVSVVMTSDPYVVNADDSLVDVVRTMHDQKYGAVPVVDAERRPIGIVTSIDLLGLLAERL